jgi:LEA14-like dessication related protein
LRKIFIVILVIICLAGLLALYFYFFPDQAKNILVPEVTRVENVKARVRPDSAFVTLSVLLSNKGLFTINIDSVRLSLFFDSLLILKQQRKVSIRLTPGDSAGYQIPVAVSMKKLFKGIMGVQERDSAMLFTDLDLVYSTVFGKKTLHYEKVSHIPSPRLPTFIVGKPRIVGFKKGRYHIIVPVTMVNNGHMDFKLKGLAYDIDVDGRIQGHGAISDEIDIRPKATISRDLPVEAKISRVPSTILGVLTDHDTYPFTIRLKGNVVNEKNGDLIPVDLTQTGVTELKK